MLYNAYQVLADFGDNVRMMATGAQSLLGAWSDGPYASPTKNMAAFSEVVALAGFTHKRPDYGIRDVEIGGERRAVREEISLKTPFCDLLRFVKEGGEDDPEVLLVAPMSGHFATLLRGTLRTLLRDHQVYITDWINPRDISLEHGRFGLEDYTQYIIDFVTFIGDECHVVAVCQPCVPALAAAAVMAAEGRNVQPASLTLMAGPIDVRIAPNAVNKLANEKPLSWFEETLISSVPWKCVGRGRRVYPGFVQLSAFMNMNLERHSKAMLDLFHARVEGEDAKADSIKEFYGEYLAIMDMTAEFYLETIDQVFQRCLLPKGELKYKGESIDPRAIKKTFLLTVEGEKDDICSVGQTLAAQDLCSGLRPYMKTHHLQAGVGHYGVFNGRRWDTQVYPVVRNHIQASRFS